MIRVVGGGLSTTVQDAGRFGLYHLGVPPSGALDGFSYRVANMLVEHRVLQRAEYFCNRGPYVSGREKEGFLVEADGAVVRRRTRR